MNENNLTNKLDRIDSAINTMREKLVMNPSASIEEIAEATDLKPLSNIFIQENEPQNKNGIWIQADKESHPWNKIKIDKNIIIPTLWQNDSPRTFIAASGYKAIAEQWSYCRFATIIGNKIFLTATRGLSNAINDFYEYNLDTKAVTYHTHVWTTNSMTDWCITSDGARYAYMPMTTSANLIIWDTQNKTVSTVTAGSAWWRKAIFNPVDGLVYLAPTTDGTARIGTFDPSTQTTTEYSTTSQSYHRHIVPIGDHKVLTISGEGNSNGADAKTFAFVRDLINGTVEKIETNFQDYKIATSEQVLIQSDSILFIKRAKDSDINIGSKITRVLKVDKETLIAEDITEKFTANELAYPLMILNKDDKYYAMCGVSYKDEGLEKQGIYVIPMQCDSVKYDDNMIVIMQSRLSYSEKQTAIWTYPPLIEGSFKQSFYDVFYHSKETGFNFTLPTYYGDGEKWIKFKN